VLPFEAGKGARLSPPRGDAHLDIPRSRSVPQRTGWGGWSLDTGHRRLGSGRALCRDSQYRPDKQGPAARAPAGAMGGSSGTKGEVLGSTAGRQVEWLTGACLAHWGLSAGVVCGRQAGGRRCSNCAVLWSRGKSSPVRGCDTHQGRVSVAAGRGAHHHCPLRTTYHVPRTTYVPRTMDDGRWTMD
jgi:hypothetical protein